MTERPIGNGMAEVTARAGPAGLATGNRTPSPGDAGREIPGWPAGQHAENLNSIAHEADNLSAGTQVVALVEVRGTNNSLVHPRGAVGVITRTPTDEEQPFLVRFPDGFEFPLRREQLDVLKRFKAGLGNEAGVPHVQTEGFDLESLRWASS